MADVILPANAHMPMDELIALVSKRYHGGMSTTMHTPGDPIHRLFLANDPKDVELFRPLLESDNEYLVGAACVYLGRIGDVQSFERLAALTQHANPDIRRMAAQALGRLGTDISTPVLLTLAHDPVDDVRSALPGALRHVPGEAASKALLDIYRQDANSLTRHQALRFLQERQDLSVLPDMVGLLNSRSSGSRADDLNEVVEALKYEETRQKPIEQSNGVTPAATVPESTYCGYGLVIENAQHDFRDNKVHVNANVVGDGGEGVPFMIRDGAPLLVPVDDDDRDNFVQYVMFQDGQEVERGDVVPEASLSRYMMIPFHSIARGVTVRPESFVTRLPPGHYELQIEFRSICTELTFFNYPANSWGSGAREPKREAFTLTSNRVPLAIHAPTCLSADSIAELARIMAERSDTSYACTLHYVAEQGEIFTNPRMVEPQRASWLLLPEAVAALPAVLSHFDPQSPTYAQVSFITSCESPEADAALDEARVHANAQTQPWLEPQTTKSIAELVTIATQEIGSQGWSWMESRDALVALDGKLGPADAQYARAFANELEQRLAGERDRHAGRSGESFWGAFHTAFVLGRIGDPLAIPVLRQAAEFIPVQRDDWGANSQTIFVRWYAAAALKLIDVQQMPDGARASEIKKWIHHCFSSPEEHYMARARLLPYLRQLLGDEAEPFFSELAQTLDDPWMKHDAMRVSTRVASTP